MANEPDEVSTANDNEVADLDAALAPPLAEDDTVLEAKEGGTIEAPLEDARPGDDVDDDAAPNLPNSMAPEEKRKRNQEFRRLQKEKRKEKEEQVKRDLAMLRSTNAALNDRLATIEKRSVGGDLAALDAKIKSAGEAYVWYKNQIAEQQRANNPDGVAEATDKMFHAGREHDHFTNVRKGYTQTQARGAQPTVDPELSRHANKWMGDNRWYNPASGDDDSAIVVALDKTLLNSGYNPSTEAYWTELSTRVAKYLPHRAKSGYTPPNSGGRSPVAGGGAAGGGSAVAKGNFTLSADRVKAMKDAGMYDDPKKRAVMIAQYKKYDAEHASN